jgi:hypothetical protein
MARHVDAVRKNFRCVVGRNVRTTIRFAADAPQKQSPAETSAGLKL